MAFRRNYSTSDLDLIEQATQNQARKSFWAYRQFLRPKMKMGWWQKEIAYELQKFYEDLSAGKRPILLIMAPPQHGKSVQIVDFLSWLAGKDPSIRAIYSSFSERLGVRANLSLQRVYDSPKYQRLFPETKISERNAVSISSQTLRNREILEYVDAEGYFRNTTVRGAITGEGLDLGIIDDPIKGREEASSKTIRDKTWDWLTDDFMSRFSDHAGLLGIMTRWHVDDPFGRLEKINSRVRAIKYQAIAEQDETYRKAGDPLFPELKSLEFLQERQASMHPHNWSALYQQNPVIAGGNIFKEEWLRFWSAIPRIVYTKVYADTAQKTGEENDYSVFQFWGKGEDGKIYLLDMIRGKWEAPELLDRAFAFWAKCKKSKHGAPRKMKIEDKSSGSGLIQQLKGIPVEGIPRNRDKTARAYDTSPQVQIGNVLLMRDNEHTSDMIQEIINLPSGSHDDTVDPMMDAIQDMLINEEGFNLSALTQL